MKEVDPRWYDGFFEAEWLDFVQPDDEVTRKQVDFVVDELALTPGSSVLDVACGRGRHSVELARQGFHVTGVDLSARSLELARAAAKQAGVAVEDPVALAPVFRDRDWRELEDGSVLVEQRAYDHLNGTIRGTWTVIGPEGSRTVSRHSTRAYAPSELRVLLRRADLEVERAWGSFDRTELGDGTRTIVLARKL